MNLITYYFPDITDTQHRQFAVLRSLYLRWNTRINLISRKDIDNLYERHVLHSLAIARIIRFHEGSRVLDVGTGGGFPGIPLAVFFPETEFVLIDSIGKKILAVTDIARMLELKNVETKNIRLQEEKGKYDFIVSRAVMPLGDLVPLARKNIAREQRNALPNGIICLKGGDQLEQEVQPYRHKATVYDLSREFSEEFFTTKKAVYVPL